MKYKYKKKEAKTLPKHTKNEIRNYNKRQWGILTFAGSWGHLGPKRAPRAKNSSKTQFALPPWTPQVGPQNRQKSILRPSKRENLFDRLLGGVLMPFGANLAPTWSPKPSQNRPKLGPSWTQVGNFEGQVASYMKFGQHHKNLEKPIVF
jgi:hypothetical protein